MNTEEKRRRFDELVDAHLNGDTGRDVELRALAASDPELQRRLDAALAISDGLGVMRADEPGPAFAARVRAALPRRGNVVPLEVPRRNRRATLLQLAAAVALTLAGLVAGYVIGRGSVAPLPTIAGKADPGRLAVPVKFLFHAPEAARVAVVGNFNGWNEGAHTLVKGPGGWWTLEITLQPGRYNYVYLVDGEKWETDPAATLVEDDGFGRRNSVLDI
jgi:hypothetical protein